VLDLNGKPEFFISRVLLFSFYDFISGLDLKCSSFLFSVQCACLILLLFSFLATGGALAGVCFNPLQALPRFSSISVWVHSPFCSCAEATAATGSGEFAPPIIWSLLALSVRFLCREFVRSLLLHFAGPQCASQSGLLCPATQFASAPVFFDGCPILLLGAHLDPVEGAPLC
jgi:hypothetical protein